MYSWLIMKSVILAGNLTKKKLSVPNLLLIVAISENTTEHY